jgi:hypothetical protein
MLRDPFFSRFCWFLGRLGELGYHQQVESWDLAAGGTEGTSASEGAGSSVWIAKATTNR